MTSRRLTIVLILVFVLSAYNIAWPAAGKDSVLEVTLSSSDGTPIAGGTIMLSGPMETGPAQAIASGSGSAPKPMPTESTSATDKNGRASFQNLVPGQYFIRGQKEGYLGLSPIGSNIPPGSLMSTVVQIQAGQAPQNISLTLIRGVTVSGIVTDSAGEPLSNVRVSIGMITFRNGRRTFQSSAYAQTDDRGSYRLFWLAPGEYFVLAQAQQRMTSMQAAEYPTTYYPGSIGIAKATPITISGRESLSGINFALQKVPLYRVKGKISNLPAPADSQPSSSTSSFTIVPRDSSEPELPMLQTVQARIDPATGVFEIAGIPPGSWNLFPMIMPAVQTGSIVPSPLRYISGHASVDVKNKDVDGVTIKVGSVNVKCTIVMPEPSSTVPSALLASNITLSLQPCENSPSYPTYQTSRQMGSGRDFEIQGVPPGKYYLAFPMVPLPLYISDIRLGSKSIFNDGIITIGTQPPEPVQVILSAASTFITGTISGITPDTTVGILSSTRVVLIPAPPRQQNKMLYKSVQVQTVTGSFSFSGVAPGDYKVLAIQGLPQGMELDPAVLARYENRARSVTVTPGGRAYDLRLEWIRDAE